METIKLNEIFADKDSFECFLEFKTYRDNILPFLGAGMSAFAGYPLWNAFLKEQINFLSVDTSISSEISDVRRQLKEKEYLQVASNIDRMLNYNLVERVRTAFSLKSGAMRPVYADVFETINATTIMTTNYDPLIETNVRFESSHPSVCFPFSTYDLVKNDKRKKPMVLKLHGSYDSLDTIVLTSEQYKEKYENNGAIRDAMSYFWNTKTILFLGCSLEKDYLINYLNSLASTNRNMYHYAILEIPRTKKLFQQKMVQLNRLKIRPIWYPNGSHEPVNIILKLLCSQTGFSADDYQDASFETNSGGAFSDAKMLSEKYVDRIATKCNEKVRERLFRALSKSDASANDKNSSLPILFDAITKTEKSIVLGVTGEPGTGKSTLLSLLYEHAKENYANKKIIPIYIDLHMFDSADEGNRSYDDIENAFSLVHSIQTENVILFIDGIDCYPRADNQLDVVLATHLDKISKQNNIKIAYSCGQLPPNEFDFKKANGGKLLGKIKNPFVELHLSLIDTQNPIYHEIMVLVFTICGITRGKVRDSKAIDKLKTTINQAAGYYVDFRTCVFIAERYFENANIIDKPIGEIYLNYYADETLYQKSGKLTRFMLDKPRDDDDNNVLLVYKSSSIRNFMYAHYYVYSVLNKHCENLGVFDCILPPCFNGFAKSLINQSAKTCDTFIENAISAYDELSIEQQTQILYFFGRVKYSKKVAEKFLTQEYNRTVDALNGFEASSSNNEMLMKYRTIGISLIYVGNHDKEDEFFEKLIYHPRLRRINRLFHLDYYTNDLYIIGEPRNLENVQRSKDKVERLYSFLYNTISNRPPKGIHSYYLSIITIINLVIYDHYRSSDSLNLYLSSGFRKLLDGLVKEEGLSNQVIKKYIIQINSKWQKDTSGLIKSPMTDDNVNKTLIELFYGLKKTVRAGWLKEGREINSREQPESVSDHTWACCMLGMMLLSEEISMCSFMRNENLSDYSVYNKGHIIELLLIHDLPESYTGDIIGNSSEKERLEKEFTEKIRIYDSFPYYRSFKSISRLIDEYNQKATINAQIAQDIDKLEPLLQLYLYYDILVDTQGDEKANSEVAKWKDTVDRDLITTLGRKMFEFITVNFLNTLS